MSARCCRLQVPREDPFSDDLDLDLDLSLGDTSFYVLFQFECIPILADEVNVDSQDVAILFEEFQVLLKDKTFV